MFKDTQAFSSFSVNDLAKAKEFYGQTLGLTVAESPQGLDVELGGGGKLFIYTKPNHEAATFTVLNFAVDNIDNTVDKLIAAGIIFEQYEGMLKTDAKGIARTSNPEEGPSIAWFKDPAGNVLAVLESQNS